MAQVGILFQDGETHMTGKELHRECTQAAPALAAWFENQGMDCQQVLATMAMLMASIITKQSFGSLTKAMTKTTLIMDLIDSMVLANMLENAARGKRG